MLCATSPLSAPSRDQLTLDMLVDAVESWGDEQVEKQAESQSTVTDSDFEVTAVAIGSTSGVRVMRSVDTNGDGKADSEAESWMMPNTLSFALALYTASDKVVVSALSKYVVGMPVHNRESNFVHGRAQEHAGCCGPACAVS